MSLVFLREALEPLRTLLLTLHSELLSLQKQLVEEARERLDELILSVKEALSVLPRVDASRHFEDHAQFVLKEGG